MKKLFPMILFFIFLFPGLDLTRAQTNAATQPAFPQDKYIAELSLEFKRLRNLSGHFQNGSWNKEVDSWLGLKHRVMMALRAHIEQNRISVGELRKLMGEPDRILYIGGPPWDSIISWSEANFSLIYEWRGDHDYLVFDCRTGMVTSSHWFYAGDK